MIWKTIERIRRYIQSLSRDRIEDLYRERNRLLADIRNCKETQEHLQIRTKESESSEEDDTQLKAVLAHLRELDAELAVIEREIDSFYEIAA